MPTPKTTTWPLDPHTQAKHVILRKYLEAWLPIMTSYGQNVLLVDGFAGPGEYTGGEPGSPLIMIDTLLSHSYTKLQNRHVSFLFVEENRARYEHLKNLLQARRFPPTLDYKQYLGRFDEAMSGLLEVLESGLKRFDAMFFFIDPFGYSHATMHLIQSLMSYPKSEVLVTLMSEEINRFLTVDYRTKDLYYDELFGTSEWRHIPENASNPTERMQQQHDLYRRQLIKVGGAEYVRSFRMRNKHNSTDYFLFFGTKHLRGLEAMKRAMWKVDPTGAFDFSDFSNPYQPVSLWQEPNYEDLKRLLTKQFQSQLVPIEEVEEYVLAETAYVTCKKDALKPMEISLPPKIRVVNPPPRRSRGTFSDSNMLIEFLP